MLNICVYVHNEIGSSLVTGVTGKYCPTISGPVLPNGVTTNVYCLVEILNTSQNCWREC